MKLLITQFFVLFAAIAMAQNPFSGETYAVEIEAEDKKGNKQVLKQVTSIDSYDELQKIFEGSSIVRDFADEIMNDVKKNYSAGEAYKFSTSEKGKSVSVEINEGNTADIADIGNVHERIIIRNNKGILDDEHVFVMPEGRSSFAIAGLNDRETAFLGVSVGPFNWKEADKNHPKGVEVKSVVDGEAAFNAGIEAGDVITAVGAVKTPSPSLFTKAIRDLEPGTDVDITFYRDGKKRVESTTLGVNTGFNFEMDMNDFDFPMPDFNGEGLQWMGDGAGQAQLGIYGEDGEAGVVITEVMDDSAAAEAKLQSGDIVTEFDGQKVTSMAELKAFVVSKEIGDVVDVKVKRDGKTIKEKVTLQEGKAIQLFMPEGNFQFNLDESNELLQQYLSPDRLKELEERLKELELKLEQRLEKSKFNKS